MKTQIQKSNRGDGGGWRRLATEVTGSNRRLWRQAAASLAGAVVAGGYYGGDGQLWRRRKEQRQQSRVIVWLSLLPLRRLQPVKPQRHKDFLRLREGQTEHYGLQALRCVAGKATLSHVSLTWRNRRLPSPPQINWSVRL